MSSDMIQLSGISKSFKVADRETGMLSALKSFVRPKFRTVEALRNVSFSIARGEIVGYIGPNGAGKSTTIKVMSGILVPNEGSCRIHGFTPWKDRAEYVKHIGVVFGQRTQLWWDVPVIDSFALLRDIYRVPQKAYEQNLDLLIETLNIRDIIQTPVRQLSLGQRMRCEIAASLLHGPDVLFLDEPTIGLDAASKIAVRQFIKTINREKGVTVILTTHDMNDIEALAQRIILIGKGELLFDGQIDTLRKRFGANKSVTVDFEPGEASIKIPGVSVLFQTNERAKLMVDTEQVNMSQVITSLASQLQLKDVSVDAQPIEDIIIQLYKEYEIA